MRRLLAILLAIGLSRAAAAQWDEPPVAEPESTLTSLARPVWMVTQLHMGVPLLLDVDREVIRPGANLGLRLSVASRFFGGGVHASYQWIPVESGARDPEFQTAGRTPLERAAFGAFVSLDGSNRSAFTPYLQGGFDAQLWRFDESEIVCDFWSCTSAGAHRFAPALSGRLGGKFALAAKRHVFLDVGCETALSFKGSFFTARRGALMPYFGVGLRN